MIDYLYRFWYWITGLSIKAVLGSVFVLVIGSGIVLYGVNLSSDKVVVEGVGGEVRESDRYIKGQVWDSNELVIWHVGRGEQLEPLLASNDDIVPNFKIKSVSFDRYEDVEGALNEVANSGNGPDLVIGDVGLSKFIDNGLLVKYNDGVFGVKLDRDDYSDVVFRSSAVKNDFVGVPLSIESSLFFYNKEIFSVKAPSSVEEMAEWYIKNYKSYGGLCVDKLPRDGQALLSNLGGVPWVNVTGEPESIGESIVKGDFLLNFARLASVGDGKFINSVGDGKCLKGFTDGKYGFLLADSRVGAKLDGEKFGVGLFPSGREKGSGFVSSSVVFVGQGAVSTDRAKAVGAVLGYLNSLDYQVRVGDSLGYIPSRSDAIKELSFGNNMLEQVIGNGLALERDIVKKSGWEEAAAKIFEINAMKRADEREKEFGKLRDTYKKRLESYLKSKGK
ncbi:MAG: extracellular solute-binding protein [Candidatus Paceibacterota bacterium]